MNIIILGNAVSLIGAGIMVLIGFIKSKEKMLAAQCLQFAVMGAGNLILGGVSGFIANMVSLVRNLICFKRPLGVTLKLVFIAIQIVLGVMSGLDGIISWLPIITGCVFTWFIDLKDPVKFKTLIIGCQIAWMFYDISIINYVSFAFDLFTVLTNLFGIWKIKTEKSSANS